MLTLVPAFCLLSHRPVCELLVKSNLNLRFVKDPLSIGLGTSFVAMVPNFKEEIENAKDDMYHQVFQTVITLFTSNSALPSRGRRAVTWRLF